MSCELIQTGSWYRDLLSVGVEAQVVIVRVFCIEVDYPKEWTLNFG